MNKIEQIREERKELLQLVSNNIKENKDNLVQNIEEITSVIEFDEQNTKKYEAIVKAKEIIAELVEQIANCKNPEEIAKTRNRINYYINKIKAELKTRNISDEQMASYTEQVSAVRNDIAKYIRCLKRENNLDELEQLDNKDFLTIEEKEQRKKLLRNEKSFNRRYLNVKKEEPKAEVLEPVTDELEFNENVTPSGLHFENDEFVVIDDEPLYLEGEKKEKDSDSLFMPFDDEPKRTANYDGMSFSFEREQPISSTSLAVIPTLNEVLQEKANSYKLRYKMREPYKYGKNVLVNIGYFVKNLPINMINRWRIDNMEEEYYNYYHSSDFGAYIKYSKKRNSIMHGLKNILSKSYLTSKENECLNNHDLCANWLMEYCNDAELGNVFNQYCLAK